VPDARAAIEHLARVFLAGFQIPADATCEQVWRHVEQEFRRLAKTLPPAEAAMLEAAVRRVIDQSPRS
jgi:predicted nuclease with RNAse H fold